MAFFGVPLSVRRSQTSVQIIEPTLGMDVTQPPTDLPLGATPSARNFIMHEGALTVRPKLTRVQTSVNIDPSDTTISYRGGSITGVFEGIDLNGLRWLYASTTTRPHVHGISGVPAGGGGASAFGGWSFLSYVPANSINDQPSGLATDYWDATQIYSSLTDENIAVWANGSYETLYCNIIGSRGTLFSTVTDAPMAKYVSAYDNYLLAFNLRDPGSLQSTFAQRVQWSDRGDPFAWSSGLAGFEDLLDAKGVGTRIVGQENRIVLFFSEEIWQGFTVQFPFLFRFQPLDRAVGCPFSWTVANTPRGTLFLGKDFQVYLLPKDGGSAVAVGRPLHRNLRNNIDLPSRAWATYSQQFDQYQLFFPVKGGSGFPERGAFLSLSEGNWSEHDFGSSSSNIGLTRGIAASISTRLSSSATTWGGASQVGISWAEAPLTWGQMGGTDTGESIDLPVVVGTSGGTIANFASNATTDLGVPVRSFWQSSALFGEAFNVQKTIKRLVVEYSAPSSSTVTVGFSPNQGVDFVDRQSLRLPANSGGSQIEAFTRIPARYPMFRVEAEDSNARLLRFHVEASLGGR